MEFPGFTIHQQVLGSVFLLALVLGAVASKTNFCTMGAVSDWINLGDTGRLRAWLLAMAVALAGVLVLEASLGLDLDSATFPPYRTASFAWLRYLLGGLMFGFGMTLASGCGNKTLIRIGSGNLKSLLVLLVASFFAYQMLWGELYAVLFDRWIAATAIDLRASGMASQELSAVLAGLGGLGESSMDLHLTVGATVALAMLGFIFASAEFRASRDNMLGGTVVGLVVVAGWWITGGSMGAAWKEYAEMAVEVPSRVQTQSFTFVSPMADTARFLMAPGQTGNLNFGVMALCGVITGALAYSLATRRFRIEWFADREDFLHHVIGGSLMGIGGVLAMGCTFGQAITGFSTLALGSILAFCAMVGGSVLAMKYLYWRAMRG